MKLSVPLFASADMWRRRYWWGDFVGHDRVVHGNKVSGHKIGGDMITVGDVSSTGITMDRDARAAVTQGLSGADLDKMFTP